MTLRLTLILALLLVCPRRASALTPDNLLLIVNRNVPESIRLAEFYRSARGVPDNRILSLHFPINDEIAQSFHDQQVVPAIRDFLRKNQLEDKVTCLVTFYGVPLRIGRRAPNAAEQREVAYLQGELSKVIEQAKLAIEKLELDAIQANPEFKAAPGDDLEALTRRAELALRAHAQIAASAKEPDDQRTRINNIVDATRLLGGPSAVLRVFQGAPRGVAQTDDDRQRLAELQASVAAAAAEMQKLSESRWDPAARNRMRALASASLGAMGLARLLHSHLDYLGAANPVASLDSELSLLWWDQFPRDNWRPNLLHYRSMAAASSAGEQLPRTLMVMRLDAPQSGMVREMILTSLKAERDGLTGRVVLDSRGIKDAQEEKKVGSYAWYDQSIRGLAQIVREKTRLPVLHDESPGVLHPGSAENVAIYCGWYSVRNYVDSMRFAHGAVGYHVASFELVSLRDPNERGWVKGLISDGIAASLGSVAEPYLHAFPPADDFFPLLFTGRLTLAEVYWRTTPLSSWMMSCIGDPLYVPFKVNPQLQTNELPERLRAAIPSPSTQPSPR